MLSYITSMFTRLRPDFCFADRLISVRFAVIEPILVLIQTVKSLKLTQFSALREHEKLFKIESLICVPRIG